MSKAKDKLKHLKERAATYITVMVVLLVIALGMVWLGVGVVVDYFLKKRDKIRGVNESYQQEKKLRSNQ